jgi:hypothetical protein
MLLAVCTVLRGRTLAAVATVAVVVAAAAAQACVLVQFAVVLCSVGMN